MDEGAGEGDGEVDDTLYCTCQRKSYGEMIGCDNDDCQFEWVSANSLEEVESNTDALPSSTSAVLVSRRRCQRHGTAQIVCADLDSPRATAPRRAGIKTRRAESGRSRVFVLITSRSYVGLSLYLCSRSLRHYRCMEYKVALTVHAHCSVLYYRDAGRSGNGLGQALRTRYIPAHALTALAGPKLVKLTGLTDGRVGGRRREIFHHHAGRLRVISQQGRLEDVPCTLVGGIRGDRSPLYHSLVCARF